MKRLFSFFAILSLLSVASCMQDPEADFRAPTVSASCTPGSNYGEVTLTIQVSNKHFKDCGFWYGTSSDLSDKKSLPVSGISGQSTGEARLTGLETGITYYYQAYVNSGRTSVTSSILHFTLDDVMNVDTDGFVVSYPETDLQVRVETTLPITVDLGGADWIEEIQTKGLDVYNKVFHISRNTELADRSATIRIASTNGKFKKDIPVQQSGGPITIPDEAFKAYMVANFDRNGDGEIVVKEAEAVERIDVTSDEIVSLQGIEYCTNLRFLKCIGSSGGDSSSGKLASVDVTQCSKLESLSVGNNVLTSLDVSHNPELTFLDPGYNQLATIDLSKNTKLKDLWIGRNQLESIDLTHNSDLAILDLWSNKLTQLDVSNCPNLTMLNIGSNKITAIDLSHNSKINDLTLQGNPIKQLPDIWALPLKSLHVSSLVSGQPADFLTHFPDLESVNFSGYDGATLDLSKNTKLRDVWCYDMGVIQILDLSAAPGLKGLRCKAWDDSGWNKNLRAVYVHSGVEFETLEKNESTVIYYTDGDNHLNINPSNFEIDYKEQVFTVTVDSNLDVAPDLGDVKWISLYGQTENTLSFKAARNYTTDDRQASFIIRTGNGQLEKEVKVTQTGGPIEIPDAVFKQYMVDNFDQDRDGEITPAEARVIERIDITTDDIVTLQGIEFCSKLEYLRCIGTTWGESYGTGKLAHVDVTHCPELEELIVYWNMLTELDVTQCPRLRNLHPARNLLTALDISNNPELEYLAADYNQIKEIDLSHNQKLKCLNLEVNRLSTLDVSNNTHLLSLMCGQNQIQSIDLSRTREITELSIYGTPMEIPDIWSLPLTYLDLNGMAMGQPSDFLTHFPDLKNVNFSGYDGTSIDLSQNTKLETVGCSSMNRIKVLDLSASPNLRVLYCNTWGANSFVVYLHPNVQLEDFDKDPDTKFYYTDGNDHLTVTPSFLEMDYPEAVFTVTVDSNLDVATDMRGVQWVTPTTIAGQPKGTLAFKVARNYNTESRTATFAILAGGGKLQKEVTVNQAAGPIEIPDAAFKQYMVDNFDRNRDGEITPLEAAAITRINIQSHDIVSLRGIEYCTELRSLICVGSYDCYGKLSYVDVTHCPNLEELGLYYNILTELDVTQCPKLKVFYPSYNQLTSLDLRSNHELVEFGAESNPLTSVLLSNHPKLTRFCVGGSLIKQIDVSQCPALERLIVSDNQLTFVDISHNPNLIELSIQGNPLEQLPDFWSLPLVSLHLSGLVKGLPSDFLRGFPNLESVNFWDYDGTSIDLSQNTKLKDVWCGGMINMTELDLSAATGLRQLYCQGGTLKKVYVHTGVSFEALEKNDDTEIIYK